MFVYVCLTQSLFSFRLHVFSSYEEMGPRQLGWGEAARCYCKWSWMIQWSEADSQWPVIGFMLWCHLINKSLKVVCIVLWLSLTGSGGDGMADSQDDRQRCRPPVESRQPRQVHQGIKRHSVSFLCGGSWDDLQLLSKCFLLCVCSYDPTEEPKDCHSMKTLATPVRNCTHGSPCNELQYPDNEEGILSPPQPPCVCMCVCACECVRG